MPSPAEYREIFASLGLDVSGLAASPVTPRASKIDATAADQGYTPEDRRFLAALREYQERVGRMDLAPDDYRALNVELGYRID